MLVALVVAQRPGIVVEPFGSEPHPRGGGHRRRVGRRVGCRLSGGAAAQHRADARQQLAQLAGFGEGIVGAELEADHAIDRARSGWEPTYRYTWAAIEGCAGYGSRTFRTVPIAPDTLR